MDVESSKSVSRFDQKEYNSLLSMGRQHARQFLAQWEAIMVTNNNNNAINVTVDDDQKNKDELRKREELFQLLEQESLVLELEHIFFFVQSFLKLNFSIRHK